MGKAARRKKSTNTGPVGPQRAAPASLPTVDAGRDAISLGLGAHVTQADEAGTTLRVLVLDTRVLAWSLVAAGLVAFLWTIRSLLTNFLFVGVFTFVGAPAVARLARHMSRTAASGVVVIAAGLAIVGMFAAVVPQLVSDLTEASRALPDLVSGASGWIERTFKIKVPVQVERLSSQAAGDVLARLMPLAEGSGDVVAAGAAGMVQGALGALGVLLQVLITPVLVFFLLSELPGAGRVVAPLVPRSLAPVVAHYLPLVHETLSRLVRGQATVAVIMAVLYAIGLSIAGVPFVLAIAVLSGAAYLVPFASGAVCLVLSAAFSLLHLDAPALPVLMGALVTVIVVQLVEGYVLTPRIVGAEAGLSPLAAVLAVLVGGAAGGFLGVLFALPIAAVLALILREESHRSGGLLVVKPEARS